MARLVFDTADESTPYDLDRELVPWFLAGAGAYPVAAAGLRGPARELDGTAGYTATDADSVHMGLRAVTLRMLLQVDFDALAGTTATLAARGSNGATAGEFWAWDVRLDVDAGATQATVVLAWQDENGAAVTYTLGTFDRPSAGAWTHLSVTRETVGAESLQRLTVNGVPYAEVTAADQIPATPGEAVTLGCRANQSVGGGYDQFFAGVIEQAEVLTTAVTSLQERHAALALLTAPDDALRVLQAYWADTSEVLEYRGGSNYERYRLRPLAAGQALIDVAILRREEAGLPDRAYDERLTTWEGALNLQGDGLSIAQRQAQATAALALVDGISRTVLEAFVDDVLGMGTRLEEWLRYLDLLSPSALWLGDDLDEVSGALLTAAGTAAEMAASVELSYSCPWDRRVLTMAKGLTDTWTTPSAALMNIDALEAVAIVLAYRITDSDAATDYTLAGTREGADLNGWEIAITAAGALVFRLDSGVAAPVEVELDAVSLVAGWHVAVLRYDPTTGDLTGSSELQAGITSFAADASSATAAALGAYRAEPTPGWECAVFGAIRGAAAAALSPHLLAIQVHEALQDVPDMAALFTDATGLRATTLCAGRAIDEIEGELLTPVSTADLAAQSSGLSRPTVFNTTGTEAWEAQTSNVMDLSTASCIFVIAYSISAFTGGSTEAIAGKRTGTALADSGWELVKSAGGNLIWNVDDVAGSVLGLNVGMPSVAPGWHVAVMQFKASNGDLTLATELATVTSAGVWLGRDGTSSQAFSLGAFRGLTSPTMQVAIAASFYGDATETIVPATLAAALHARLDL